MRLLPLILLFFLTVAKGYSQLTPKQQKRAVKITELFEKYYEIPEGNCNKAYKAKRKLDRKLSKMHRGIDEQDYSQFFYDQIKSTLQTRDMKQMTKEINRFVYFFPTDHRVEALLNVKARTNIEQRSWMQLDKTIREMKSNSEVTGTDHSETITQLTEVLHQLMATESYENTMLGVWVSDSVDKKSSTPLLALRIYEEGAELYRGTSFERTKGLKANGELPPNFYYSSGTAIDSTGCFEVSFFARNVNPANINMANYAIGQAQSNLSHSVASIAAGNTAGMTAGLVGAGFNALFAYAMSQSSTNDACMFLRMRPRNENVMDVDIRLLTDASQSTDPILIKKYEKTMHTTLYKVNAADNMVLYTKTPVSLYNNTPKSSEGDFNNLESITHVKNAKLPTGVAILTGYMTYGIIPICYSAKLKKEKSKHNLRTINDIKVQALQRQAIIDEYLNQYPINENGTNN